MSEPGRFSLEKLVSALPFGRLTLFAAALAGIAACVMSRETLTKIPELVETSYSYDAQLRATLGSRSYVSEGKVTDDIGVTFVDVDAAALNAWSDATHTTPRNRIVELLNLLVDENPALIFIDFDLSGSSAGNGDEALRTFLTTYNADKPPLLLTREIDTPVCAGSDCSKPTCAAAPMEDKPGTPNSINVLPFEIAAGKKSNVFWVSSAFSPDHDGVVRSWRLWDEVCRNGNIEIWPSPQLVAAALAGQSLAKGKARLDAYLKTRTADEQDQGARSAWPLNGNARDVFVPFLIGGSQQSRVSDWRGAAGFRYQRVSAMSLIDHQVAIQALNGRAIVVGASYGSDKFATPFGVMPGATLISNAIAVAPAVLNHPPAPKILVQALTLVLFAAYAIIAKLFKALPAALVILALSYVWLSLATSLLNPADAVQTTSTALVILGVFLAIDTLLEMAASVRDGKTIGSALLRKSSPSKTKPNEQLELP